MAMYCMCMLDFTYVSARGITVLSETLNIELTHTNKSGFKFTIYISNLDRGGKYTIRKHVC